MEWNLIKTSGEEEEEEVEDRRETKEWGKAYG